MVVDAVAHALRLPTDVLKALAALRRVERLARVDAQVAVTDKPGACDVHLQGAQGDGGVEAAEFEAPDCPFALEGSHRCQFDAAAAPGLVLEGVCAVASAVSGLAPVCAVELDLSVSDAEEEAEIVAVKLVVGRE